MYFNIKQCLFLFLKSLTFCLRSYPIAEHLIDMEPMMNLRSLTYDRHL